MTEHSERFEFETDMNRLMKLIINSLYKTKEIFLRELISNASDALDKVRFLSLINQQALGDLKITITADKARKTLTIADTGVGMTKDDLKRNLGTIAKSGTAEFMSALQNATADSNLIGQFGVGFYSAFLVADKVTVVTKNDADAQFIWESTSDNTFSITEDPRGPTLGRGTQIVLHLKDDAIQYLDESMLRELVGRYNQFINFPIFLWTTKTITESLPSENGEPNDHMDDDIEDVTEEVQEETPRTVTRTTSQWELLNDNRPIWTRSPSDVEEAEYHTFYKAFTHDSGDPMSYIHFKGEGSVDFKGLIFIPSRPPHDFLQQSHNWTHNIKLFVRRVLITDELPDFLPRWLSFIKGLIDSDDLPLNVSRESLQAHGTLNTIKRRVIGKALDMLKRLASNDGEKYLNFFRAYGNALKLGILEERNLEKKLSSLLRFKSSHSNDYVSLDDYLSRMRENQPQIYFVTGESVDAMAASPLVEKVVARGYEVLYMDQPIDEYLTARLVSYRGKALQNVGKAGLKYGDEDELLNAEAEKQEKIFEPLKSFLLEELKEWVGTVRLSKQLTTSPCAVLSSEWGVSGAMERIMQAQALSSKDDPMAAMYLNQKKVFELNPDHPLIERMLEKVNAGEQDEVKDSIYVLFESTALASGYNVRNAKEFSKRIEMIIRQKMGVDASTEPKPKILPAPPMTESSPAVDDDTDDLPDHDEL
ncbi:Hsp90 protein-domain-containing protein [Gaertneriomyces semiglobifer]|nr:Hsp90 protein-domain-containing protein [Gaertneriomyces semiglobifer]